jgi:PAS domain S-box-containing protein
MGTLDDPATLGLALGAVLTAITIWKRVEMSKWIVLCWQKTGGKAHHEIHIGMAKLSKMLVEVTKELKSNGRGTIHEQLSRIEEQGEDTYALTGAKLHVDQQAMFVTDKYGKVTSNNYQHQMLTGFSSEQVAHDQWILVIDPVDRDMVHRKWNEAVDQRRNFSEDIWYVTPKGRRYKVHVKASRQLDSNGDLRGWLGVVTPLDEVGRAICIFHHDRCEETLLTLKETHKREGIE